MWLIKQEELAELRQGTEQRENCNRKEQQKWEGMELGKKTMHMRQNFAGLGSEVLLLAK